MRGRKRQKIVLIPYPAQGHVTPMLKLASTLVNNGFEAVVIVPEFIHRRIAIHEEPRSSILILPIPDGLDEETPRDFSTIEFAMENNMAHHLERMMMCELDDPEDDQVIVCVVVDLLASWAIKVANRCRIPVAGFWPAMLATYRLIAAIPDMVAAGIISETGTPQHQGTRCLLPYQPMLCTEDLPWLIGTPASRKSRFRFWIRTLNRSKTLRWILINSFPEESDLPNENFFEDNYQENPFLFPIEPLFKPVLNKSPSFWEEDRSCLKWLDTQNPGSVVYVSFGSWVGPIGEQKVNSLAHGLEYSKSPFLWVLGPTCHEGLPVGYLERISKQGKVVSWAPQMEVLQHKAVGCFLTHCGWNSTVEAIKCKKKLLCYPIAGDQFVNCTYIVKFWKIGVRIHRFGYKEIEEGVKRVMEDDVMNLRLTKLNERVVGVDATSRAMGNLTAFIEDLMKIE